MPGSSKYAAKKIKKSAIDSVKIFVRNISDKGFISRIYKKLLWSNKKIKNGQKI